MSRGRALLGVATVATCAALLAGCGGKASQAGSTYVDKLPMPVDTMLVDTEEVGRYGGRFVIAQTAGPKTFNAIMANETSSTDITNNLFTSLTDFNSVTQGMESRLAKTWGVSEDGRTWTFHLRRGAAFSDGHPMTAEDVLFSIEVCYDDSLHPSIQDLMMTDGKKWEVSAPDSYTVVITTPRPYALFLPASGSVRIMPKHMLERAFRAGDYAAAYATSSPPESIVTSGAWRLKQYLAGEKTVLERNPYWFGVDSKGQRLPYLDELVWLIVPDQNTMALKFQSGELDGIDDVKPEDYQTFANGQQKGNYTLYDLGPALTTNFFWVNLNLVREPKPGKRVGDPEVAPAKYAWFKERDFRRALSMAVDRDAIIKGVYFGDAVKNWSTSTAGNRIWFDPAVTGADYNPEEAKRLLAGLGYKDGNGDGILEDTKGNPITFTMKTNSGNKLREAMTNFIRDDLAKVGIRVIPSPVEFNTLITNLRQDFQYESILLGLSSAVPPDPGMGQNVWRSSGLTHYWYIKQPKPATPAEAQIDRLMDENVGTVDMEVRQRTWRQIQDLVNGETFVMWLPTLKAKLPVRNNFGNVHPTVIPHRILWNVDQIFYKPRRPA